jgi:hypothetical protein
LAVQNGTFLLLMTYTAIMEPIRLEKSFVSNHLLMLGMPVLGVLVAYWGFPRVLPIFVAQLGIGLYFTLLLHLKRIDHSAYRMLNVLIMPALALMVGLFLTAILWVLG